MTSFISEEVVKMVPSFISEEVVEIYQTMSESESTRKDFPEKIYTKVNRQMYSFVQTLVIDTYAELRIQSHLIR